MTRLVSKWRSCLSAFLHVDVYEGDCRCVQSDGKILIFLNAKTHSIFQENDSFSPRNKVHGHIYVEQRKKHGLRKNKLAKLLGNKQ